MGGRGASSGVSASGKPYGSEYHAVYQSGNIKFVEVNEGANADPMETMTQGRVYVTVDKNTKELKYISYYDKNNARAEYRNLVSRGVIRDKTTVERLLTTAHGNYDNSSVQAARRSLEKRGIDWKTGKKKKRS